MAMRYGRPTDNDIACWFVAEVLDNGCCAIEKERLEALTGKEMTEERYNRLIEHISRKVGRMIRTLRVKKETPV